MINHLTTSTLLKPSPGCCMQADRHPNPCKYFADSQHQRLSNRSSSNPTTNNACRPCSRSRRRKVRAKQSPLVDLTDRRSESTKGVAATDIFLTAGVGLLYSDPIGLMTDYRSLVDADCDFVRSPHADRPMSRLSPPTSHACNRLAPARPLRKTILL